MLGRSKPTPEEPLLRDIVVFLMKMDAKLDEIRQALGVDDGEEGLDA